MTEDNREMLCRGLPVEIGMPAGNDEPLLQVTASDETVDRYHEVLSADGWKLDQYQRNPVFLNAHDSYDVLSVIGRAEETAVVKGRLRQRIRFAVEENPMARIAWGLYRGGYMRAVSVGFRPLRWEDGSPELGYRRKYIEQELVEVSAVPVPANPAALVDGLGSGHVRAADLEELIELLRRIAPSHAHAHAHDRSGYSPTPTDPDGQAGATASGVNVAPLLESARRLERALLRH